MSNSTNNKQLLFVGVLPYDITLDKAILANTLFNGNVISHTYFYDSESQNCDPTLLFEVNGMVFAVRFKLTEVSGAHKVMLTVEKKESSHQRDLLKSNEQHTLVFQSMEEYNETLQFLKEHYLSEIGEPDPFNLFEIAEIPVTYWVKNIINLA